MKKRIKFTKKVSLVFASLIVGLTLVGTAVPQLALAQTSKDEFNTPDKGTTCPKGQYQKEGGIPCATDRTIATPKANKASLVDELVNPFIQLMTAIVGIVIAISLVMAGISYSAAGGDPNQVAAAKKRIMNCIVALVAYIFAFGLVQWLVPGGVI